MEREKLRVPSKSEEAYNEFFASDEVDRLIDELIVDRLAISQILLVGILVGGIGPAHGQFFGPRKKKADEAARVTPGPGGAGRPGP